MNTEFTPGPWRIGSLESYDGYTGKPFRNVWAGESDADDAKVVARCIDNGNCDDDARLISAAPSLFESCLMTLEALDYLRGLWGDEAISRGLADAIRASVVKATGREP